MPRPPLHEIAAKRIALLKPSALGDIVHTLPVLHALRVRFPEARVSWVVGRTFAALLHGHPDLDETIAFDRRGGLRAALALGHELRRQRFDLVIDLQGLLRTGLMGAATFAPRRVGLSTAREGAGLFYTDVVRVPDAESTHAVDRYWLVAQALGIGRVAKRFDVPLRDDALAWADVTLRGRPRPWLVVAPVSRWITKRWPPSNFAELVRRSGRLHGGSAIVVGSAEDANLACDMPGLDLVGRTTLPQLAALLARADAVLANDSGPLHLAAALGRPVVAPYTCTKIVKHGPYRQPGAVATDVACHGSYLKRCGSLACMSELTPDRLWPALDRVLSSWRSYSRSA
jgi:lipopolysaccharide heptosyltransferase I